MHILTEIFKAFDCSKKLENIWVYEDRFVREMLHLEQRGIRKLGVH